MPLLSAVYESDAKLTNVAFKTYQNGTEFLADKLAPQINVTKPSQKIYSVDPYFEEGRDESDLREKVKRAIGVDLYKTEDD